MRRLLTMLMLATLVAGCSFIPKYERPEPAIPATWPPVASEAATPSVPGEGGIPASDIGWRDFFVDPQLRHLIDKAFENNPDVAIVALQVEQVRAQYQLQRAEILPQISAQLSYTKQQNPSTFNSNSNIGAGPGGAGGGGGSAGSTNAGSFEFYRAGVGLTAYELDLFGRIRSLERQALDQYLASIEAARSAQITLVSQVAAAYANLLADSELKELAQKTLDAQEESSRLIGKRFDVGIASALEMNQARTTVETARADLAQFSRLLAQDRNALVALTGVSIPPGSIKPGSLSTPKVSAELTPGLSSDVLLRRPDVLQAEHNLTSANANIGAARAAFFPRISLVSNYGTISGDLNGLFGAGTEIWSFSPQISLPIFDGGRNRANLEVAEVTKNIEVARYQKTIQTAFREVADALAARATVQDELAATQALADASRSSYNLSLKRYRQGIDNFLTVLDSQRSYYQAQQQLIDAQLLGLTSTVNMYKVLGGGWRERTPDAKQADNGNNYPDAGLPFWSRFSSYIPTGKD